MIVKLTSFHQTVNANLWKQKGPKTRKFVQSSEECCVKVLRISDGAIFQIKLASHDNGFLRLSYKRDIMFFFPSYDAICV